MKLSIVIPYYRAATTVATQLEAEDSLKRTIKSAMVYPLLIAAFAMLKPRLQRQKAAPSGTRNARGAQQRAQ